MNIEEKSYYNEESNKYPIPIRLNKRSKRIKNKKL